MKTFRKYKNQCMMRQNIFSKNDIIYLFHDNRQNDCTTNIKQIHTHKTNIQFYIKYEVKRKVKEKSE